MKFIGAFLGAGAMISLVAACATGSAPDVDDDFVQTPLATGDVAYAQLRGADGTIHGRVVLTEYNTGVRVDANLENIPAGTHALHVHETGDCSAADFTSAGGHWNPEGVPHPGHKGDLPNFTPDAGGSAVVSETVEGVSLNDMTYPLADMDGAALIIHADADDMASQPSGNAGARIACGVVTMG